MRVIVLTNMEKLREVNEEWRNCKSDKGAYMKPAGETSLLGRGERLEIGVPQHIASIALQPDMVVYSNLLKRVSLIELTCTCDNTCDNKDQKARKEKRYEQLLVEIETAGWKGDLGDIFTVEVGCRGFYHHKLPRMLNFFTTSAGLGRREHGTAVVSLKEESTEHSSSGVSQRLSLYNKILQLAIGRKTCYSLI